jgi:hypothetical protein
MRNHFYFEKHSPSNFLLSMLKEASPSRFTHNKTWADAWIVDWSTSHKTVDKDIGPRKWWQWLVWWLTPNLKIIWLTLRRTHCCFGAFVEERKKNSLSFVCFMILKKSPPPLVWSVVFHDKHTITSQDLYILYVVLFHVHVTTCILNDTPVAPILWVSLTHVSTFGILRMVGF